MRKTLLSGVLISTLIFVTQSQTASALTLESTDKNSTNNQSGLLLAIATDKPLPAFKDTAFADTNEKLQEVQKTKDEETVEHTIAVGESLSDIAIEHGTTWKRIYDKNESIENPDVILVDEVVMIPEADEVLAERTVPVVSRPVARNQAVKKASAQSSQQSASAPTTASVSVGSSAGNLYGAGYCTWYVKNQRPDLPNNLGNARTWVSRAAAQGMATGSTPRVGAVGQRSNHVVYVEAVNGDGTMVISEMNYRNLYEKTVRTVNASEWSFVY